MNKSLSRLVFLTVLVISLVGGTTAFAKPAANRGPSPAGSIPAENAFWLDKNRSGIPDLLEEEMGMRPWHESILPSTVLAPPDWYALDGGLNDFVYGIGVIGNDMYAGGGFTNAGGNNQADYIARWNGSNWSPVGTGLNDSVLAIAVVGNALYVGGWFTDAGGDPDADYIAIWDGTNWSAVGGGLNSYVTAVAVSDNGMVYAGGGFIDAGGNASADYVAMWNGSAWSALGSGVGSPVVKIAISGSDVYVGGGFVDVGGNPKANRIARWNGSNWFALGNGLNDWPEAIFIDGDDVYVGGFFTNAGGHASADYLARWNGSAWFPVGGGLNDHVWEIIVNGNKVYVGGDFSDAGGNHNADSIAIWNGSSWSALGTGIEFPGAMGVMVMGLSGKNVYAGGWFSSAGGKPNTSHIAFYGIPTQIFRSQAGKDGWVLESSETSGVGGTMSSTATNIYVGDNAQRKQYRAILSFNTAPLPDNAVITKVILRLKLQGMVGSNPFNTHGNLVVDVRKGAFGGIGALQVSDFQAAASKSNVGSIPKTAVSGWYTKTWTSGIATYVNKKGVTQFRLRFAKDDDNDAVADYLKFYSGNANASYQPKLVIEYYVP